MAFTCPPSLVTKGFQEKVILSFIPDWIRKGFVVELPNPTPFLCHFSRMFSVPKGTSERRPIIDLSPMNQLLRKKHFKMEDLRKVAKCLFPGLWAVKLDLKDAYMHLRLATAIICLFAFSLGDRIFAFQVLPFGLSTAPWAFSRVLKPIKKALRLMNILISSFLDDFLILARSFQEAVEHTSQTIDLLQRLGFEINWEKSSLFPTRRLEYLGVIIDLEAMTFSLPQEKILKILQFCKATEASSLKRKELERLIGFLSFAADFLPLGRLWLKPIQLWFNRNSSPLEREREVWLDGDLRQALLPWSNLAFLSSAVPIHPPPPSLVLMTDASEEGWSGVLQPELAEGSWSDLQLENSMNWLELKAIHLSLLAFLPQLKGRCISLRSDNRTALSCIRRQGSLSSQALWSLSKEVLVLCLENEIFLSPRHLRGVLNVLADKGSRRSAISTEWSLDDKSFQEICEEWGRPQVDLMATWENNKLSQYISPCPDFNSLGWDIFSFEDWNIWDSIYIFPPGHPGGSLSEVEIIPGQGFRNSPLVALQAMVPHSRQEVPCQGSPPRGTCSLPGDYKRNSFLPQHFRLQALRLDVMRESLLKDGFSPKAVDIILGCHKESTIRLSISLG